MNYNNWYLVRVWKQSKFLFFVILFFIGFQVFFSAKRVQNFPFFIFDMYSRPIEKYDTFTLYEIKETNKIFNYTQLTDIKENTLLNSIGAFVGNQNICPNFLHEKVLDGRFKNKVSANTYQFIKNGLKNNIDFEQKFPSWLNKNFIHTSDSFFIEKNTYHYSDKKLIQSKSILRNDGK